MKLPFKERVLLSGVVFALAAVLVALAILQYRWAREVSDATSTRLQASLDSSMLSWRDDLYRELTSVFGTLRADPTLSSHEKAAQYAQQFQTWSQSASHPNLISRVLLLEGAATEHSQLLQLNISGSQFEPVAWPPELDKLHSWVQARSRDSNTHVAHFRLRQEFHRADPGGDAFLKQGFLNAEFIPAMFDSEAMALARPQIHVDPAKIKTSQPLVPVVDWLVVELDRKVLQEHIFPELAERHFSGPDGMDYQVAIVAASGSLVYSSDSGFGKPDIASADRRMPVFGPPHGPPPHRGTNTAFAQAPHPRPGMTNARNAFGFPGSVRLDTIHPPGEDNDWQLAARHRKGSLEAVVTGMRHRNLALSFGVLLVLAAGIAIIVVSSQRARVLARLQMDFVAAVSHELRTPLAVISSAAENISDGVVAGKQQLSQYGAEIKNQAKHLIQLVEQILLFASTRNKRHHYNLRPLRVEDVIDAALKDTAGLIEASQVTLEQEIAPNLPPVIGDLPALTHCLQNLITNAVKYGGDARWMRIKAGVNEANGQLEEVQISVEDKGMGIGASELRHIFEPFYRSRTAAAAQIHGTGLGLPLAREIAEAMGGRLTVSSEPGKGSCFTLYLKFADVSVLQARTQTAAAVNPKFSKT